MSELSDATAFFDDELAHTPIALIQQGYIFLSNFMQADRACLKPIELAVAGGILRWYSRLYERRRESGDYDYWLISMGTAMVASAAAIRAAAQEGETLPDPGSWQQFRQDLWDEMRADRWLKFYDCITCDDQLWRAATLLAYMKLFHGEFAEG